MKVLFMTIPTRGKRHFFEFSRCVTLFALESAVFASERIAGLIVVIDSGFPGHFGMTLRAGGPLGRKVRVAVTAKTAGRGNAPPLFLGVAFLARDFGVGSLEGKSPAAMVEFQLFEGYVQGMALIAVLSKLSLMNVFVAEFALDALDQVGAA